MTVEYALTRTEIVRGFFRSLSISPKFRATILLNLTFIAALVLLLRIALSGSFKTWDALVAVAWALGALAFLPLWLFIRGKTEKRTLTISPDGIRTEIGKIRAQVSWDKIKLVTNAGQFILIAKRGGNSFFIPVRAFSSLNNRDLFLAEIERWKKTSV